MIFLFTNPNRQIAGGLLHLTVEEDAALKSLQAVFPQHSMWSLSAIVALHSHHFQTPVQNLLPSCMDFLLGEDGADLDAFLCPLTRLDDPETFLGK